MTTKQPIKSNLQTMDLPDHLKNLETVQRALALLCAWYPANARDLPWRRAEAIHDPYRILVSEIMLQQTRVEAVKGYYTRFLAAFPDVQTLASAPEQQLLKLWEGLGYYSRARNLQKAAHQVVERFGGLIPADYEQLRSLAGVGAYTAGAVGSIAFGLPVSAVDGNVLRVLSRLLGHTGEVDDPKIKASYQKLCDAAIGAVTGQTSSGCGTIPQPDDPHQNAQTVCAAGGKITPGMCNQAWMELGATVCLPNGAPACDRCPWQSMCAAKDGLWQSLPVKKPKRARKKTALTVLVVLTKDANGGNRLAVRKRPDTGLLAGLWELPWLPGHLSAEHTVNALKQMGLECHPDLIAPLPDARHIFTHLEWEMRGWQLTYTLDPSAVSMSGWEWVTFDELLHTVPLPSAFGVYRTHALAALDG